jgi:hypothetical protein
VELLNVLLNGLKKNGVNALSRVVMMEFRKEKLIVNEFPLMGKFILLDLKLEIDQ